MGRRDRHELESRLTVLLSHLLKWKIQPSGRTSGWSGTIREQRRQISRKLRDIPSLRPLVDESVAKIYADARAKAAAETGILEAAFLHSARSWRLMYCPPRFCLHRAEEKSVPRNTPDYEQDFYAWTIEQAKLLRAGELSQIDLKNIAEEIESLGRRDRREVTDRLENVIVELLKWRVQAGARCGNWRSEILQQRFQIAQIIEDSPSLRRFATERLRKAYSDARERVVENLRLLHPEFPADCPFTLDQIMAEDFLPEG